MIFYEGSKRFVGDEFKKQKSEVRSQKIKKVGVFVNEKYESIIKAIEDYYLDVIQLHGDETDEFCLELMDKVEVIKVFRLTGKENIDELVEPFQNVCHHFMFDTSPHPSLPPTGEGAATTQPMPPLTPPTGENKTHPLFNQYAAVNKVIRKSEVSEWLSSSVGGSRMGAGPSYGGTGLQFDWSILKKAKINKPFFLSGGIGLEDVEKIKSFEHPYLLAVDVNSRFEISPGIKDMEKVQRFIAEINF
jgi:phosphoribosylanthranilate isomerase